MKSLIKHLYSMNNVSLFLFGSICMLSCGEILIYFRSFLWHAYNQMVKVVERISLISIDACLYQFNE